MKIISIINQNFIKSYQYSSTRNFILFFTAYGQRQSFSTINSTSNSVISELQKQCTINMDLITILVSSLEKQNDWNSLKSTEIRLKKNLEVADPNDWNSIAQTQKQLSRVVQILLENSVTTTRYSGLQSIYQMAILEKDCELLKEVNSDLTHFKSHLQDLSLKQLMTGEFDASSCLIELRAGSGGLESCDLVGMLVRMYLKYGDAKYDTECTVIESNPDTLGYKSAVLKIEGAYAYGFLKYESGVHRMGRRHTTFASVQVLPYGNQENSIQKNIEIPGRDLKIETMKSQGAGGQHVNKTECQNERSQHQNKATAMKVLQSRLIERELRIQYTNIRLNQYYPLLLLDRAKNKAEHYAEMPDVAWGNHIRTYVLHPYQLVKDTRTMYETCDVYGVLEGDIDGFLNASLIHFKKEVIN